MIKQRVAQYIKKEELLKPQSKVLVALSGGADSVALLRILLSLGYNCKAAHCNFHLRNDESDRDEKFVTLLCKDLNVPLQTISFDTKSYARTNKLSIEMAARELRYQWFDELKHNDSFSHIAIAHHRDDSIETMLLNLIRGTGINGLLGIRPINGDIIRPLLCVSRNEIIGYLEEIKQEYVTDSTNLQDEYTRNKIRLKLLPLMQEINPSIKESLFQTGNYLNQVATVYQQAIKESRYKTESQGNINITSLLAEPSPEALLFEILFPLGFNPAQINDIAKSLQGQSGKQFISKQGVRVIKDRDALLIDKPKEKEDTTPPFQLLFEKQAYSPSFVIPKEKNTACFDADKLKEPIMIRKWKQGDFFIPFGMKGKKKVSDYLTDRKLSISEKEEQWVLCSNNQIAWIIGERTDNRFRIDSETQHLIIVKRK